MKGPIAKGTIRTTFVLGFRLVIQACTLLLVARMLGPRQFGAFAGIAALAMMLGTLGTFGTHLVLLSEVSKGPTRRTYVMSYAVPTTLLCGVILLVIYLGVCLLALQAAGVSITVLLAIGITETLLQPLLGLPSAEHLALGRIARSQLLQALPLALRLLAATVVLLWRPDDPLAAYGYGYLTASVVALAIATATMPKSWPRPLTWRLPRNTELREAAGYAVLNITASGPTELDKTLATRLLPLPIAGLYTAGARIIGAAVLPVIAMMLSALPRLFREGRDQPLRTARLISLILVAALGYSIAIAIVLWFTAPIFALIFGTKYDGIQYMIRWLCLSTPGMALRIVEGSILMALGKPWMRVGFEVTGLVILTATTLVLTARLGSVGMPLALACSEWGMAILGGILVIHTNNKEVVPQN